MAGVPTYESQLAERPLPTPYDDTRVSPAAYGAGVGQGLQQLSEGVGDVARYEKQNADAAVVINAVAQAKDAYNSVILDDKAGYSSLRGKDAMDGRDQAIQAFNSKIEKIGSGLQNDQQRLHFAQFANTIREQAVTHAIAHESVERERYSQAGFRGAVDQTMVTMENPSVIASSASLQQQIDSLYQTGIAEAQRRYGASASKDAIASVVVPELQKAALGTMEAATAAAEQGGDPAVAKQAFDQVGKYLVVGHQRQYAARIEALSRRAAVDAGAGQILQASTDSIPVPGGSPVPRLDATRLAAALGGLPPDSPYLPALQKAVEQRELLLGRVWNMAVGTVVQRVESAALRGGPFDLSRPGVSAQDMEWLRMNAPDQLFKLQGQERKVDSAEAKAASSEAWSTLSADMANPGRKDFYSNLTVPEFTTMTVDQGLSPQDRIKAVKLFGDMLKGAQTEKVNRTVAEQLAAAIPFNKDERDKLQGPLLDKANEFIDQWKAAAEGKGPTTEQIRTFVNRELIRVKVPGTGLLFDDRMRRVLFETNPVFAGRQAVPVDTDIAAPAPPVRAAAPAGAVRVVAPDGSHGSIPAGSLDEALKQGYRRE